MSTTHKHQVIDKDALFTVDAIKRTIVNTDPNKNLIMQGDHNSERFTFKIPRYIEGHDMLMSNHVTVPFLNTENTGKNRDRKYATGVYMVSDLEVSAEDKNYLTCSWLISRNATNYTGDLNFQLVLSCMNGSTIDYRWKTDIFEGIHVIESLDADLVFEAEYVDVIEQWKVDLFNELTEYVDESVKKHVDVKQIETNKNDIITLTGEITNVRNSVAKEAIKREEEIDALNARIAKIIALGDGSTTGDAELSDIRVGFNGIEYPTAGDAVRAQVSQIQDSVGDLYDNLANALSGNVMRIYPVWEPGGIDGATGSENDAFNRYRSQGYIRVYAPRLTITTGENMMVIILGFTVTENGMEVGEQLSAEGEKTFTPKCEYYRFIAKDTVDDQIDDASVLDDIVISYSPEVAYAKTAYVDERFDITNEMIINQRYSVPNKWEMGGIDGSNGNYTDATDRIRTVDFYKPVSSKIHYSIADGYRLLIYEFDKDHVLQGMHGYFTGNGSIDIDVSLYYKFMLRGVNTIQFTGNEYTNVSIYSELPESNDDKVPEYWIETLEAKEKQIKDIVIAATKKDQDIAMFYTIADPHYPSNSGVSTILRKYLSERCGITCVVNLNDGMHWRQASYFGEDYEFVGDAPVKANGTVTECAFDVVIVNRTTKHVDLIRIGAGENRSYNY